MYKIWNYNLINRKKVFFQIYNTDFNLMVSHTFAMKLQKNSYYNDIFEIWYLVKHWNIFMLTFWIT